MKIDKLSVNELIPHLEEFYFKYSLHDDWKSINLNSSMLEKPYMLCVPGSPIIIVLYHVS